ncbi:MAG: AbrB/MazE/SpoVT family DNA-binding domain-containing protein [Spirochaetaceae bacterium]|jgi:AbrB family looped-hinge helix DNA binding protein|nr:AbrB/MazE/SpoVT family DNA-binding domain-containing protein [Spirochaetaceae bacterium]
MKITQKGQVTIPQEIRERHNFPPNSNIEFVEEGDRVYVIKAEADVVKESPFDEVKGIYSLKLSTDEIMKLTRDNE